MKIGISGHQNIRPDSAVKWVKTILRQELQNHHAASGVSSLAAGVDQIFAAIVLEMGLELEVVIPCSAYESAFGDKESKERFVDLNGRANHHHFLDFGQPSEEAFLRAGQRVVDTSDLMIFVWDGMPARGLGGTADVVAYARANGRPFIHLNPTDSSIERHYST